MGKQAAAGKSGELQLGIQNKGRPEKKEGEKEIWLQRTSGLFKGRKRTGKTDWEGRMGKKWNSRRYRQVCGQIPFVESKAGSVNGEIPRAGVDGEVATCISEGLSTAERSLLLSRERTGVFSAAQLSRPCLATNQSR